MKTLVLGVGNAGVSAVDHMSMRYDADYMAVDSDETSLKTAKVDDKVLMGESVDLPLLEGHIGTGGQYDLGVKIAGASKDKIIKMVEGYDKVNVVAGLGGGTGSGSTKVIAEACDSVAEDINIFVFFPFSMEGEKRKENAEKALEELRDGFEVEVLHLDDLIDEYSDMSLRTAFKVADEKMARTMELPERPEEEVLKRKIEDKEREIKETEEEASKVRKDVEDLKEERKELEQKLEEIN